VAGFRKGTRGHLPASEPWQLSRWQRTLASAGQHPSMCLASQGSGGQPAAGQAASSQHEWEHWGHGANTPGRHFQQLAPGGPRRPRALNMKGRGRGASQHSMVAAPGAMLGGRENVNSHRHRGPFFSGCTQILSEGGQQLGSGDCAHLDSQAGRERDV
jgi:hypothetical protein